MTQRSAALVAIAVSILALGLQGCIAASVAGAGIGVAGAVVGTAVKVTGATVDAAGHVITGGSKSH